MSRPKPSGRSEAEIRRLMQEAATRALDRAHLKVSSGAFDYKSAVKSAVDSLADTMKYVTYPTGHTDTLEVAARRAVLTGVNQTAGKLQVAGADTTQSAVKLKAAREELAAFTRATSGRVDSARTSVAGFGRREAGKAAWAARSDSKRSYHDVLNGVIVPTNESVQNIPFAKLSGMTDAQTLALQKAHPAVLQLVL